MKLEDQITQLADAVDEQIQQPGSAEPATGRRGRRWLLNAAAGLLVLGGVGAIATVASRSETPPGSGSPDVTPQQVAQWRADLDRQLPLASASQQDAMEDGVITVTEALGLAQEASDCSVEASGPPIRFEWNGKGLEHGVNSGTDDSGEADAIFAIAESCWDDRVGLAERYIGLQQVLPVEDQQRLRQLTVGCLADAGIEAPEWPGTDVEIDSSIEATCVDQAEALLD